MSGDEMVPGVGAAPSAPADGDISAELGDAGRAVLDELRWHWGKAYEIGCVGKTWTARSLHNGAKLTADSAVGLHEVIREHHSDLTAVERRSSPAGMGEGERALRQLRDHGVI